MNDLAKRVTGIPQITTDQFRNYAFAIRGAFGDRCSYATEAKEFVTTSSKLQRFSSMHAACAGVRPSRLLCLRTRL